MGTGALLSSVQSRLSFAIWGKKKLFDEVGGDRGRVCCSSLQISYWSSTTCTLLLCASLSFPLFLVSRISSPPPEDGRFQGTVVASPVQQHHDTRRGLLRGQHDWPVRLPLLVGLQQQHGKTLTLLLQFYSPVFKLSPVARTQQLQQLVSIVFSLQGSQAAGEEERASEGSLQGREQQQEKCRVRKVRVADIHWKFTGQFVFCCTWRHVIVYT